jgi:hypothetical protein
MPNNHQFDEHRVKNLSPASTIRQMSMEDYKRYFQEGVRFANLDFQDLHGEEKKIWRRRYGNYFSGLSAMTRGICRKLPSHIRREMVEKYLEETNGMLDRTNIIGDADDFIEQSEFESLIDDIQKGN